MSVDSLTGFTKAEEQQFALQDQIDQEEREKLVKETKVDFYATLRHVNKYLHKLNNKHGDPDLISLLVNTAAARFKCPPPIPEQMETNFSNKRKMISENGQFTCETITTVVERIFITLSFNQ